MDSSRTMDGGQQHVSSQASSLELNHCRKRKRDDSNTSSPPPCHSGNRPCSRLQLEEPNGLNSGEGDGDNNKLSDFSFPRVAATAATSQDYENYESEYKNDDDNDEEGDDEDYDE